MEVEGHYYQKILDDAGVDLNQPLDVEKYATIDVDPQDFVDFTVKYRSEATVKSFHPRPFLDHEFNHIATCANWIGYNAHNTTESNWGLDPTHNTMLKEIIGISNFDRLGLDPNACLLRLLEYNPGHTLPLHFDGKEGFRSLYGDETRADRFFVAISAWDWGHFLQVHDKMIYNWNPGDTWIIPPNVWHLSGNAGIQPKLTLTITGVINGKE
jgi:hypothetical protein